MTARQLMGLWLLATATSASWAEGEDRPVASDGGDQVIYRRIEQVRRATAGFRLDGSDRDWRQVPQLTDPRGDAGGDPGRDLVAAAVAPRQNDLWIMLRTAGKPSTDPWAFYVEVDLLADPGDDFRIELESLERGPVLRPYDKRWQAGDPTPLRRAKAIVHRVVEMRLPYADIAAALPADKAALLAGKDVRPWVRIKSWTWDSERQREVDYGPAVASFRLIETPYPLDIALPSRPRPPVDVGLPLRGSWFVLQGAMGRFSHQNLWAYDLVKLDRSGYQSSPRDGKKNTDFHSWGQPVFSPIDGRTLRVRAEAEDSPPREFGRRRTAPNYIQIAAADGFALDLVHFQKGSVTVEPFGRVSAGQQVGLVGNSGNSDSPHLHMAVWAGRFPRRTAPLALTDVRVGLNSGIGDFWARELTRWEPREGFFVEAVPAGQHAR